MPYLRLETNVPTEKIPDDLPTKLCSVLSKSLGKPINVSLLRKRFTFVFNENFLSVNEIFNKKNLQKTSSFNVPYFKIFWIYLIFMHNYQNRYLPDIKNTSYDFYVSVDFIFNFTVLEPDQ